MSLSPSLLGRRSGLETGLEAGFLLPRLADAVELGGGQLFVMDQPVADEPEELSPIHVDQEQRVIRDEARIPIRRRFTERNAEAGDVLSAADRKKLRVLFVGIGGLAPRV